MRHILWGICVCGGSAVACAAPTAPMESEPLLGTYIPSSAEHALTDGEGGDGNDVLLREGEETLDYAERPQAERWCWFLDGKAETSVLYEIDMDSGEWGIRRQLADQAMDVWGNVFALHENSLVWINDGTISALDLTTDERLDVDPPAVGWPERIASNGSELLMGLCEAAGEPEALCAYPSVAALMAFTPDSSVPRAEAFVGYVDAYVGDAIYTTATVGETVTVYERATGERQRTILLAGREELAKSGGRQPVNHGLAVVGNLLLVHDGGGEAYFGPGDSDEGFQGDERGTRLDTYDVQTGQHLESLYLGERTIDPTGDINPSGLVCGGAF